MSRNLAVVLVCWNIWRRMDLTCSFLSRTSSERKSLLRHGTLTRVRRMVRFFVHFLPEPSWCTSTCTLMGIEQRLRRNTQEQFLRRDQSGTNCARTSSMTQGVISLSSGRIELVRSNWSNSKRYPTAATSHRKRLPTSVACTQQLNPQVAA